MKHTALAWAHAFLMVWRSLPGAVAGWQDAALYICNAGDPTVLGEYRQGEWSDGVKRWENNNGMAVWRHEGYWYIGDTTKWPPQTMYRCIKGCAQDVDLPPVSGFVGTRFSTAEGGDLTPKHLSESMTILYEDNATDIYAYTVNYQVDAELQRGVRHVTRAIVAGWFDARDDDMDVSTIGGGITNLLFKVTLHPKAGASTATRYEVLVRVYGRNTEVIIERERENDLFAQLSRLGFAPKYLGRFENGRVEEYFRASALQPEQMGQTSPVDYCGMIARELCSMHSLNVDTDRSPVLWSSVDKWARLASEITFEEPERQEILEGLGLDKLRDEVSWLKEVLATESHGTTRAKDIIKEVVFSHQDLLCGNILYIEGDDRVRFIDFEYGGYNYRGFDIGNHWCEHAGYEPEYEQGYPKRHTQLHFLRSYVYALGEVDLGTDDREQFLEELWVVANRYGCAAQLFWGHWAIIQAKYSPIDFDFLAYAKKRLDGYKLMKKWFYEGHI